jgi:GNAT superfamily N-acetyltransferase
MQKLWDRKSQKLEPENTNTEATFAKYAGIYAEFGKIVCIGLGYFIKKDNEYVYFGMLTVRPTLQNKGAGKLLLSRLEDLAREWGYQKIRMTVISQREELIAFYQRRGFNFTGETEPFPENDPRFGLPKTKLIFHVFEKIL